MNELIGSKFIDRYEIVSRLGSGGMAVVYKAVDTVLNRIVTVKILQEELANNEKFVHRFRKEAQAVAALSHPNIVKVYDVGFSEGHHYLIMEYIEGQTLKDEIKKKGHLSVEQSLDYVYQILGGLYHAHSYGVIHRDIKPQNIMITAGNQIKIMDFGLALNLSDSTITYDNSVMGSVYYIAPEIAQKGTGDARADLYSTGIVLYEMLTGELPFTGDSPIAIALQHVEGDYEAVDDIDDSIPFEVARLVDKAMEPNPAERYHSANLMMRDVEIAAEENDITLKSALITKEFNGAAAPITPTKRQQNMDANLTRTLYEDEEAEFEAPRSRKQPSKPSSSKNKKKNGSNKRTKKIIIIAIIAILVIAAGSYAAIRIFTGTEEVTVPDVEGMQQDLAIQELKAVGLDYNIVQTPNSEVEPGVVITQDVKAGQKVKKGKKINLSVSAGTEAVAVPNVVGKDQETAKEDLERAKFAVEIKEGFSDTVAEKIVISQSPEANVEAVQGSTVTITVSKGPENKQTDMPNVVGLTESDARRVLQDHGLNVGTVTQAFSNDVASGYVTYQSVNAGTKVTEGASIDLTISKGSNTTNYSLNYTVPDTYGSPVTVVVTVSDSRGSREILNQSMNAGDTVSQTIAVSAPGTVTVSVNGNNTFSKDIS